MKYLLPFIIILTFMSCTPFEYDAIEDEHESVFLFTLENGGNCDDEIIFSFALPRDYYIDVKWAITYVSFDADITSSDLKTDSQGNTYLEVEVDGSTLKYLDHAFFAKTVEGAIPSFTFEDQDFPSSFDKSLEIYIKEGEFIPSNNQSIKEIANRVKTKNMIETLHNVITFFDDLEYDYHFFDQAETAGERGYFYLSGEKELYRTALEVLDDNAGGCYEKARLGAAILRACNIPTRIIRSSGHAWNEVYLPKDGWIPLDFSSPERTKIHSFPIEPWKPGNYDNVISIGGRDEPHFLRDWDRELFIRLNFYRHKPYDLSYFEDQERFFNNLEYIIVNPLEENNESEDFLKFFSENINALIYQQGNDYILDMGGSGILTIDFANPMIINVDGNGVPFDFTLYEDSILIKKLK